MTPLWLSPVATASAHETIVNDGMITSSPGCRLQQATATSSATEPFATATPKRLPQ